jgi:uncharacterized protein YuzB (UPF0349 family)
MNDLSFCRTGLSRHAPKLLELLQHRHPSLKLSVVDCFDRCETCEQVLLVRVDGAMVRFKKPEELIEACLELLEFQP